MCGRVRVEGCHQTLGYGDLSCFQKNLQNTLGIRIPPSFTDTNTFCFMGRTIKHFKSVLNTVFFIKDLTCKRIQFWTLILNLSGQLTKFYVKLNTQAHIYYFKSRNCYFKIKFYKLNIFDHSKYCFLFKQGCSNK